LPSVKSSRPAPYGRWWTSKPIHGWKTNRNTPPSSTSIAQRSRGPQARLPAPYSYQSELSVRNPAGLEILSQDRIGAPIGQYLSAINNLVDSSKSTKHDFRGSVIRGRFMVPDQAAISGEVWPDFVRQNASSRPDEPEQFARKLSLCRRRARPVDRMPYVSRQQIAVQNAYARAA